LLLVMPAYLGTPAALGVKVLTLVAANAGTTYPAIQGAVLLFEPEQGALAAILDANAITAIRTAAVSGLATRLLAQADAGDLAILGSGVQARSHLAAMRAVRPLRRARVWSREPDHARQFAETESARHGLRVEPVATPREAVEGADLICTVTSARDPVVAGEWLSPGAHVNAVGVTGDPGTRELDTAAVTGARLFVDRRAAALVEAGDILVPIREGAIGESHILAELGDLVLGRHPGRTDSDEITVFKSLGLAIEDVAAAQYIYARAREQGAGTRVTLGEGVR
jgi:ornithine cyclodeaminase/alanine dehydrogenase-like protein (mu-crystallin family)